MFTYVYCMKTTLKTEATHCAISVTISSALLLVMHWILDGTSFCCRFTWKQRKLQLQYCALGKMYKLVILYLLEKNGHGNDTVAEDHRWSHSKTTRQTFHIVVICWIPTCEIWNMDLLHMMHFDFFFFHTV